MGLKIAQKIKQGNGFTDFPTLFRHYQQRINQRFRRIDASDHLSAPLTTTEQAA